MTGWRNPTWPEGVTHRVLLLRHAQPHPDARGRCYGALDVPLSDTGHAQVEALIPYLAPLPVASVVTSPRMRARQCAQRLHARCWDVPLVEDPQVAELDFGAFEGLRYEEVERREPELFAAWMRTPTEVRFPGGESYADLRARVARVSERLRQTYHRQTVLVVTHGGVIRSWIAHAIGLPHTQIFRLDVDHASICCIDDYGDTSVLRVHNWTP